MMIRFTIRNTDRLNAAIEEKRKKINGNLIDKVNELTDLLYSKVIANLSGEVLQRRSGRLINSVEKMEASTFRDNMVGGYVTQDLRKAPYGSVHEKGGQKTYTIQPSNKEFLFFLAGGTMVSFVAKGQLKQFVKGRKAVFTKLVVRSKPLEKRSFMVSALESMRPEIQHGIGTVVRSK